MVRSFLFLMLSLGSLYPVLGSATTGPHLPNPLGWMHQLPTGEAPGWSGRFWFQSEISHYNVWNAPLNFVNTENGKTLQMTADFEQTSLVLETGVELSPGIALAVELPVAARHGGFMDGIIDWVHHTFDAELFRRHEFPEDRSVFEVTSNGAQQLNDNSATGLSNMKLKLRLWPVQWKTGTDGCPCGIGGSFQLKVPLSDGRKGLSSGGFDTTAAVHFGLPIGETGSLLFTGAVTFAPKNVAFEDWPREKWLGMLELSVDIGLGAGWGLVLSSRLESPFMRAHALTIADSTADAYARYQNKIASGYYGLVTWRNAIFFGARYAPSSRLRLELLAMEDLTFAQDDDFGSNVIVHNAPDFGASLKLTMTF